LVWGDYRDNTIAYHILHRYFGTVLYEAFVKDSQCICFDLKSFAFKVAKMSLSLIYGTLVDLKLKINYGFLNITEMRMRTYREHYAYLENMVEIMLLDMKDEVNYYVDIYCKSLKKLN
jgi:hypothetical protein